MRVKDYVTINIPVYIFKKTGTYALIEPKENPEFIIIALDKKYATIYSEEHKSVTTLLKQQVIPIKKKKTTQNKTTPKIKRLKSLFKPFDKVVYLFEQSLVYPEGCMSYICDKNIKDRTFNLLGSERAKKEYRTPNAKLPPRKWKAFMEFVCSLHPNIKDSIQSHPLWKSHTTPHFCVNTKYTKDLKQGYMIYIAMFLFRQAVKNHNTIHWYLYLKSLGLTIEEALVVNLHAGIALKPYNLDDTPLSEALKREVPSKLVTVIPKFATMPHCGNYNMVSVTTLNKLMQHEKDPFVFLEQLTKENIYNFLDKEI